MILLVPARIVACEGRLRWVVDLSKVIFFIGFVLRWAFSWSGPKNQFWVNKKDLDNLFWLKCLIDITGQVVLHSLEVESSEEELDAYSHIRLYNGISPLRWLWMSMVMWIYWRLNSIVEYWCFLSMLALAISA
jgi:hypothetical protein